MKTAIFFNYFIAGIMFGSTLLFYIVHTPFNALTITDR